MSGFDPVDGVPAQAFAGDIIPLSLAKLSGTYPSSDFDLALSAQRQGGTGSGPDALALAFTGNPHAGSLVLTGKTPGEWAFVIRATQKSGSGSAIVSQGILVLKADPATADGRSHAEKMLAAIEALIENRATKDQQSYAIAGRSLTRMTVKELMDWRSHYRIEVRNQRAKAAGQSTRKITLMRFP